MSIVYILLICQCLAGMAGLFLFLDYRNKILSMSISYGSFLFLIILIALQSDKQSGILTIVVTIVVIFAINVLIAIGLMRKTGSEIS